MPVDNGDPRTRWNHPPIPEWDSKAARFGGKGCGPLATAAEMI